MRLVFLQRARIPQLVTAGALLAAVVAGAAEPDREAPGAPAIVPLPKTTIEETIALEGQPAQRSEEVFVGVFALPYNTHPASRHEVPPLGFRERRQPDKITVAGAQHDATRIRWTRTAPDAVTNLDAREISIWTSDQLDAPRFEVSTSGPDLCLPPGTLRFELLPAGAGAGGGPGAVTGEYAGDSTFTLGGRERTAYRYAYQMQAEQTSLAGTLWISRDVPGGVYRHRIVAAGAETGTYQMRVKGVEPEQLRDDLHKVSDGGFAFALPPGWRRAEPRAGEALRLVPTDPDPDLNRTITVEIKPAGGKDYRQWGAAIAEDDSKFSLAGSMMEGLADTPTFEVSYWSGSKSRVPTAITGGVHDGRLYLITHRQNRVAKREHAGADAVAELARSWRWLQSPG